MFVSAKFDRLVASNEILISFLLINYSAISFESKVSTNSGFLDSQYHEISKGLFDVIVWTKKPTKIL